MDSMLSLYLSYFLAETKTAKESELSAVSVRAKARANGKSY